MNLFAQEPLQLGTPSGIPLDTFIGTPSGIPLDTFIGTPSGIPLDTFIGTPSGIPLDTPFRHSIENFLSARHPAFH